MGRLIRTEEWHFPGEDEVIEQEELTAEQIADLYLGGAFAAPDVTFLSYEKD